MRKSNIASSSSSSSSSSPRRRALSQPSSPSLASRLSSCLCPCLSSSEGDEETFPKHEKETKKIGKVVTLQPTSNGGRITTPEKGKKKKDQQGTVLCYSPLNLQEGQVDLLPRAWCTGAEEGHGDGKGAEGDGGESTSASVLDVAWRVCFYLCCCPLCYPCYVSRSLRRRGKVREERRWRDVQERSTFSNDEVDMPDSKQASSLIGESSDEMTRILFRQMSDAKRSRKSRRKAAAASVAAAAAAAASAAAAAARAASPTTSVAAAVEPTIEKIGEAGQAHQPPLPEIIETVTEDVIVPEEDDDGDDSCVINVNVIILLSESSCVLHRHLTSAGNVLLEEDADDVADGASLLRPHHSSENGRFLTIPEESYPKRPEQQQQQQQQQASSMLLLRRQFRSSPRSSANQHFSMELSAVEEVDDSVDGEEGDTPNSVFEKETAANNEDEEEEEVEFEDCVSLILEVEEERPKNAQQQLEEKRSSSRRGSRSEIGSGFAKLVRKASASLALRPSSLRSRTASEDKEQRQQHASSSSSSSSPSGGIRRKSLRPAAAAVSDAAASINVVEDDQQQPPKRSSLPPSPQPPPKRSEEGRRQKQNDRGKSQMDQDEVNTRLIDVPILPEKTSSSSSPVATRKSSIFSRVSLRRKSSSNQHQSQPSRKLSSRRRKTGAPSGLRDHLFYSFDVQDSEGEEEEGEGQEEEVERRRGRSWRGGRRHRSPKEEVVQMRDLGSRTELLSDLGYQLGFSYFDESTMSEWRGMNLRLANEMPNMDLIVLAVRQNRVSELTAVLSTRSGMMSYFAKFWRGFYPLLIVELTPDNEDNDDDEIDGGLRRGGRPVGRRGNNNGAAAAVAAKKEEEEEERDPEFTRQLSRLSLFFGEVHHIRVPESQLEQESDWITECMARLFVHARLYQCARFYGDQRLLAELPQCPGGCELRRHRVRDRRLSRKRPVRLKGAQRDVYRRSKIAM